MVATQTTHYTACSGAEIHSLSLLHRYPSLCLSLSLSGSLSLSLSLRLLRPVFRSTVPTERSDITKSKEIDVKRRIR